MKKYLIRFCTQDGKENVDFLPQNIKGTLNSITKLLVNGRLTWTLLNNTFTVFCKKEEVLGIYTMLTKKEEY